MAATASKDRAFLSTHEAVALLNDEGWQVTVGYLSYLMRDDFFPTPAKVGNGFIWLDNDLEGVRRALRGKGIVPVVKQNAA